MFPYEQKSHSKQNNKNTNQNQPNCTRYMRWTFLELCSHSLILKYSYRFGTDLSAAQVFTEEPQRGPNVYVAQTLGCGFHLGGEATVPWVFLGTGDILTHSNKICQPSFLKAGWAHSVSCHLAAFFAPSVGTKDIITPMGTLLSSLSKP